MNTFNIAALAAQYPPVADMIALKETIWFNPATTTVADALPFVGLTEQDVEAAHARLKRFAPLLAQAFPETAATGGIIESDVVAIPPCRPGWNRRTARKLQAHCC